MPRPVVIPCPLCGYHAPELSCPSCRFAPLEPSLRKPRGGVWREVRDGLAALPQGARTLLSTPGTKRLLIPPVIMTAILFGAILYLLVRALTRFFDAVATQDLTQLQIDPGWWRNLVEWLAGLQVVIAIAHAGSILVLLIAFTIAALWTFSIAYEAICGPFLDTIQARVEARWFGADPRIALEQPPGLDPERSARVSGIATVAALLFLLAYFLWDWRYDWILLVLLPAPFVVAAFAVRGSGTWLTWFLGSQARALWTSIKASLLAGLILVLFIWVKFIPVLGLPMFAMIAGFATSLTLLDIPFSRRNWSLRQRIACLMQHLPAVIALGIVTSLIFVVPFIGPLIGVPCASLGGLWLVCRVDKNKMRPPGRRITLPFAPVVVPVVKSAPRA